MKIMIAGAWDEANQDILDAAERIASKVVEKGNMIITGGGTGIPEFAIRGAANAEGLSISFSNEGHINKMSDLSTFRVATEMGWDGRSVLAVKSSDLLIVLGGCNGTLNEITLAYLNSIPIWILRNSSEMINRFEDFLYLGKFIDKRSNVEITFFDSIGDIIDKIDELY